MFRTLVTVILLTLGFPSFAQDRICGRAQVKDGDSVIISGVEIRLHRIDALELGQVCRRANGQAWACGQAAKLEMQRLLQGEVCCERKQAANSHSRVVMRCMAAGRDVGRELVTAGLALDCPRFSRETYKVDEAGAKAAKRGVWDGGSFEAPWRHKGQAYCCAAEFPREFCP
jgi:endonuclease YncB( thermonuclease family)